MQTPVGLSFRNLLLLGDTQRFREKADATENLNDNPTTVWLIATNLMQLGFSDAAVRLLRSGQLRHQNDFWLNFDLGTLLLVTQPSPSAAADGVGYLRAAFALRPKSPLVCLNLTKGLIDLGQLAEASNVLRQAFERDSPPALAFGYRSALRSLQMEVRGAEEDARRAVALDPSSAWCAARLGVALNNRKEGMTWLDRAVALSPTSGEIRALRGMELLRRELPRRALPDLTKAIELNPNLTDAWAELAIARADVRDIPGSLDAARKAVALNQRSAVAHLAVGYARTLAGRTDAETEFDLALSADPNNPMFLFQQALAYLRTRKLERARAIFERVRRLRPNVAFVYSNLGFVLADMNRLNEAGVSCRKAIELDPELAVAHSNLGYVLLLQENYLLALLSTRRAIQLDPECVPAQCNLGAILGALGNYAEAEKWNKKAISLLPDDSRPWTNLGLTYTFLERYDEAMPCLQKSYELSLNDPLPPTNLASCYFVQLRIDDTIKYSRIGVERDDTYHRAHCLLGNALLMKNQYDLAVKHLKRAVELDPKNATYNGALARAYYGVHQPKLADASFARARKLIVDNETGLGDLKYLAILAEEMDRSEDTLTLLRRGVELEPNFGDVHLFLATVLFDHGRFEELLALYRKACRRFAADSSLTKTLAKRIIATERLVEIDHRLSAVLHGQDKPKSPREALEFADMCARKPKRLYVASSSPLSSRYEIRSEVIGNGAADASLQCRLCRGVGRGRRRFGRRKA